MNFAFFKWSSFYSDFLSVMRLHNCRNNSSHLRKLPSWAIIGHGTRVLSVKTVKLHCDEMTQNHLKLKVK